MMIARLSKIFPYNKNVFFITNPKITPNSPKAPSLKVPSTPSIKPKSGEVALSTVAQQLNLK